jgi:hypothetical protein
LLVGMGRHRKEAVWPGSDTGALTAGLENTLR